MLPGVSAAGTTARALCVVGDREADASAEGGAHGVAVARPKRRRLAGFTLVATFLAHTWWQLPKGPERGHAFNGFWEHIALVGALVFAGVINYRESSA